MKNDLLLLSVLAGVNANCFLKLDKSCRKKRTPFVAVSKKQSQRTANYAPVEAQISKIIQKNPH